ncbi:MAG: hypothetical protein HQ557_05555 [Bacteroidetes bacterium]|nr:hypothetical protein [Bacteroidota bacterium]
MKQAIISYIPALSDLYAELTKFSRGAAAKNPDKIVAQTRNLLKETLPEIDISACTWRAAESDKPLGTVKADLKMGYSGTILGLLYTVEGDELLVRYTRDWDMVCQDSCVECFISSEPSSPAYVNLEFNPLGTCWAQIGPDREHRERLSEAAVSTIFRRGSITTRARDAGCLKGESRFRWETLVMLPMQKVGILTQHAGAGCDADMLKGTCLQANFYTTGDHLQNPVYQSWCPIHTPNPDFHQPEYFGELVFG